MSITPDFTTKFSTPVLSSEVGDVGFLTDQDYAEISVVRASDSALVYKASIYPDASGVCTAWMLGDIITQWMIYNSMTYGSFTFSDSVTGVSMAVNILRCSRVSVGMSGGCSSVMMAPLISSRNAIIPPSGKFFFHFIAGSTFHLQVSASVGGVDADGEKVLKVIPLPYSIKESSVCSVSVSIDGIIEFINNAIEEDESEIVSVSFVSVSVGTSPGLMSATAVVSNDQDLVGFEFINCFGLPEQIWLHGEAMPQISVKSDTASVGHRVIQYDVEHSQSFKVEASNIPESEWPRVSQFLTSPEIYEVPTGRKIYLSDISQESCRNYDSLGSLKFSYSYEDDRILL